jgi:3-dehydroquinate synthase
VSGTVRVELGERAYDVMVGQGMLGRAGALIALLLTTARKRVVIVTDTTPWALHGATLTASLRGAGITFDVIEIEPGEGSKSFASFQRVTEALLALTVERGDLVIAFGGGVTGDLTGFAAGVTKRGIDFVQIPTTLLAQVDSSVGGKTAINASAGKNLVGLFWQPRLVLADLDVLATLPPRDMAAGWAEVIKIGMIHDRDFFDWCAANGAAAISGDVSVLGHAVKAAVQAKANIVAQDEREGGVRALLNLGHTFGHAFEACVGFDESVLRHGEAVACGMAMAHRFSVKLGLCPKEDARQVEDALDGAGLAAFPSDLAGGPWDAGALSQAMTHDKKNEDGNLTLILTRGIGQAFVQKRVDGAEVLAFINEDLNR